MEAAQAVLAAFDTSLSRQWRDEDRRWRAEDREWRADDLAFREEERRWFGEEAEMRSAEIRWREEDINQRHVDNARYLWARFVEKNRRDVEEKSEQLKAISNLAALFAGFAVVTLTQFQVTLDTSPLWIIALYGILTAISVCLHTVAMVQCTLIMGSGGRARGALILYCLLPACFSTPLSLLPLQVCLHTVAMVQCTLIMGSILKNGKAYVDEDAEEEFMFRCLLFVRSFSLGDRPPAPRRTFEAFWEYRCEDDWRKAFNYFTWGIFSFLLSLIPIGWIKFNFSTFIPAAFTAIVMCSMVLWAYQQLSWGAYLTKGRRQFDSLLSEAEAFRVRPSGLPFDWHIAPEASRKRSSSRRSRSGREGGSSDAASTAFADGDAGQELKPGSGLENTDGKAPRTSASGSGNGNVKASEDGASVLGSSGEKVGQGQGGKKVEEEGERASMNGGMDSTCRERREPGQEDCLIGGDSGGGGGGGDSIDVGDSGLSLAGGGNVPRAAVASKTKNASSRVSSCEISEVQE
ncbi:unnamed protein product [Closterium sp. NIES-65]|nr:unnamed protein product [Closterium sp. NIES-65]